MTVAINQVNGTQWGITLTDNTNGQSFTTDQTYTGPASTAEWIVEALTVNGAGEHARAVLAGRRASATWVFSGPTPRCKRS